MQSTKISVRIESRVSTRFLWLIKESIRKFLEKVQTRLTVYLTMHVDQALLSSLLQIEESVGAGGVNRRGGVDGLNASVL